MKNSLRSGILSAILSSTLLLGLVGCSAGANATDASGSAEIKNPVVAVNDVATINDKLDINLVLPDGAAATNCSIIDNSLGDVSFELNGQAYSYRGMASTVDEDISGLYYDFTSHDRDEVSGQSFAIEFSDGGPGYARWYVKASGVVYSVSVENSASRNLLSDMAFILIEAQG